MKIIFFIFLFVLFTDFKIIVDTTHALYPPIHQEPMANFAPILASTREWEGGYQNMASDKANYNSLGQLVGTNRGVSAKIYERYIGHPPSVQEMKDITPGIAEKVFTKYYWDYIKGSELKTQEIAEIIFGLYIGNPSKSNQIVAESLREHGKDISKVSNPYSREVVEAINSTNQKQLFDTIKQKSLSFVSGFRDEIRNGWVRKMSSFEYDGSKKKWLIISIVLLAVAAGGYYAYKHGYHKTAMQKIKHYLK